MRRGGIVQPCASRLSTPEHPPGASRLDLATRTGQTPEVVCLRTLGPGRVPVAQRIEQPPSKRPVAGSNPAGDANDPDDGPASGVQPPELHAEIRIGALGGEAELPLEHREAVRARPRGPSDQVWDPMGCLPRTRPIPSVARCHHRLGRCPRRAWWMLVGRVSGTTPSRTCSGRRARRPRPWWRRREARRRRRGGWATTGRCPCRCPRPARPRRRPAPP
jgi:hypothetical protein